MPNKEVCLDSVRTWLTWTNKNSTCRNAIQGFDNLCRKCSAPTVIVSSKEWTEVFYGYFVVLGIHDSSFLFAELLHIGRSHFVIRQNQVACIWIKFTWFGIIYLCRLQIMGIPIQLVIQMFFKQIVCCKSYKVFLHKEYS